MKSTPGCDSIRLVLKKAPDSRAGKERDMTATVRQPIPQSTARTVSAITASRLLSASDSRPMLAISAKTM